jgi:hypothetical protein
VTIPEWQIEVKRPARLAGMARIGVNRMGALADATGRCEILRFENLDTDVPPPEAAMRITGEAARRTRTTAICRSSGCGARWRAMPGGPLASPMTRTRR